MYIFFRCSSSPSNKYIFKNIQNIVIKKHAETETNRLQNRYAIFHPQKDKTTIIYKKKTIT